MLFFILLQLVIVINMIDDYPTASIHNMKIYGNASLGYYYSNFYIGTPPQRQSLILDTGSGIVAMPCQQCIQCGNRHINPRFKIKQSSTSKILTCDSGSKSCKKCSNPNDICHFGISYAQGSSLQGILIEDSVFASDEIDEYYNRSNKSQKNQKYENSLIRQSIRTVFGCTTRQTHLFVTQEADGIMGLCPVRQHNFLEELFQKHNQYTNQKHSFSLCLANNGGVFTIGGINTTLNTQINPLGKAKYNQKLSGQYTIQINQLVIDHGNKLPKQSFNINNLFIDSGATFTYFPSSQYHKIVKQLDRACVNIDCKQAIGEQYKCYQINVQNKLLEEQIKKFPNISIMLQSGEKIDWTPQEYFLLRNRTAGQVCVGFVSGRFILGATWMTGKNIFFNLQNSQIQIYQAICDPKSAPLKMLYKNELPSLESKNIIIQQDYQNWIIGIAILLCIIVLLIIIWTIKTQFKKKVNRNISIKQQKQQYQFKTFSNEEKAIS